MARGPDDVAFLRELTRRLLGRARTAVRPLIPSETLREALEVHVDPTKPEGYLEIPHYWALYVHDGQRGPFGPRRAKSLVWFSDPRNDPRLNPPAVRYSQHVPLSKAQYEYGLQMNAEYRLAGIATPYMYVVKFKTRGLLPPTLFFSKGLQPFEATIPGLVLPAVVKFVEKNLDSLTPVEFKSGTFKLAKPILLRLR